MRFFSFAVRFFLLSESFSFCRDSCRGNRTYLLLGDYTAEKEPRRGGGGVPIVRFAQCTPYTIILECHPYCKWGSVYNVHNRYWNISGRFLWKGSEPVHFCHANYILISDRGTSPKVF